MAYDTIAWEATKRTWVDAEGVAGADFNRAENNSEYLKGEVTISGTLTQQSLQFEGTAVPYEYLISGIPFLIPANRGVVVSRCASGLRLYDTISGALLTAGRIYPILKVSGTTQFEGQYYSEVRPETLIYANSSGAPVLAHFDLYFRVDDFVGGGSSLVDVRGYYGLTIRT